MFVDPKHSDPPQVRNWRIHIISILVSFGAMAIGYDTAVIGGTLALPSFQRDFGLDVADQHQRDTLSGNIVSTFQAGTFFGALLAFPMAEKYGRKIGMIVSALVFLVGGILMTASNGMLGLIYAGRAIAGLGLGSASLIVPVYIAETSPPSIRGRLVGIFEVLSQGGGMLGFWINYAVSRTISPRTHTQWVVPLALQLGPGLFLIVGTFYCPESPRWLAKQDRWDEAEASLSYMRELPSSDPYIREELRGIREQLDREGVVVKSAPLYQRLRLNELMLPGNRNRLGIGLVLMCCQNMTGVNIITYYSPRIFETLGITGTDTKLFATGFYGVAKVLGMIIFTLIIAERVGRRRGLLYGAFVGSLPMWYIGGYVFKTDPAARAARGEFHRDGWGYLAMVCVYLYGFIYCMTWQGITWTYCSEIFPIRIRMLCVALTTADQWLWSFIVSRTTPYMITSLGYGTYFFFASLMILMGFWTYFCVPETKGLTIEDMDKLFGAIPDVTASSNSDIESKRGYSEDGDSKEKVSHQEDVGASTKH